MQKCPFIDIVPENAGYVPYGYVAILLVLCDFLLVTYSVGGSFWVEMDGVSDALHDKIVRVFSGHMVFLQDAFDFFVYSDVLDFGHGSLSGYNDRGCGWRRSSGHLSDGSTD